MSGDESERKETDVESGLEISDSLRFQSRLNGIENVLSDVKSLIEFIHKERTSPRGRIDAMMTNTQHILDHVVNMKKQIDALEETVCQLQTQISLVQSLHFDVINLTDEFTKLRIQMYHGV